LTYPPGGREKDNKKKIVNRKRKDKKEREFLGWFKTCRDLRRKVRSFSKIF